MSKSQLEWGRAADAVRSAQSEKFTELIAASGLDKSQHLRFKNWSGVDFSNCDLAGFDFTGGRLHNCDFSGSSLIKAVDFRLASYARFEQAELGAVIRAPARDPRLPAKVTKLANIREAKDWMKYIKVWRPAKAAYPDSHLPVGAIFQDAPFGPEMVVVPPGSILMAESVRHQPQHEITLSKPFAVGRFPVTNEEWRFGGFPADKQISSLEGLKGKLGPHPKNMVSWGEAVRYTEYLSSQTGKRYRLLTEAEWEYCCRAGTKSQYCFGNNRARLGEYAWYIRNSKSTTWPVGRKLANAFGLHDMHGNVAEWCHDVWRPVYKDLPRAGTARSVPVYYAVRGGSYGDRHHEVRSGSRALYPGETRSSNIGFRVARDLVL